MAFLTLGDEPRVPPTIIELTEDDIPVGDTVETEDGGIEITLDAAPAAPLASAHDDNLAPLLPADLLTSLAEELLEEVDSDIQSREEYHRTYTKGMDLLGLKIEDIDWPFKGACAVNDPLLMEATLRAQATLRGELLPAAGPCKTMIVGMETPDRIAQAERVKSWMNYYLTGVNLDYYPDFDRMLFWLPFCGSVFKKAYQDPIRSRPEAPFITPDLLIVNYACSSLEKAQRITHVVHYTKAEFKRLLAKSFYLDPGPNVQPDEISDQTTVQQAVDKLTGVRPELAENDDRFMVYEVHTARELPLPGGEAPFPVPYIVSIETQSRKVIAIRRNWREGDPDMMRENWFAHYKFFPGFGFYGLGFAHILGGSAKAATMILRQMVDAGTLASFPGGFRDRGVRFTDNNLSIGPMEFVEIDTGGRSIRDVISPLPYKDISPVQQVLRQDIVEGARRLGATLDIAVGEGRQDAPVGTMVALMEAATKVESGVLKRCHEALGRELKMIADLFGRHLGDEPYPFPVPGGEMAIMRADFDDRIDVVPVADPNLVTSAQRMVRAEAMLRSAQSQPEIHDLRAAYLRFYRALNMSEQDIAAVLPPPESAQPMDPVSENMAAMSGKPLAVGPWQDDQAHITSHEPLVELPAMQAHITEHIASQYRKQIEQIIGMPLPEPGQQLPPEIENELARKVAEASGMLEKLMGGAGLDPVAVMDKEIGSKHQIEMAKIQQKSWAETMRHIDRVAERATRERLGRMKLVAELSDNKNREPVRLPAEVA